MKRKIVLSITTLAVIFATVGTSMVFAEGTTETTTDRSYTTGQQKNSDRHQKFANLPEFSSDEEREAYFEELGICRGENLRNKEETEASENSDYSYTKGKKEHQVSTYDGKSVEEKLAEGTITQEEA
ncbi:MAG: hypothetical protein ACI4VF_00600, partial [Lachnospirales bacterium]